jgi:TorA maturation chaperone TorD
MPTPGKPADPGQLRLLAGLLATPTGDSLPVLNALSEDHPWLLPGVEELTALPLDQWQGEHTRLFVNGYPKTVCPPFESAYRHGCMHGNATGQLSDLYRRLGLSAGEVPADYLGTELEAAAWLLEQLDPEPHTTGLWNELWHNHLAIWAGRFAADLRSKSELRLYRDLGEKIAALFEAQP